MKRIGLTAILLCCLLGTTACQKEESVPMASAIPNTAFTFFSSTPTPTQIPTPEPTAEPSLEFVPEEEDDWYRRRIDL